MLIQISNDTVKRVQAFVGKYYGKKLTTLKEYSSAVEKCVEEFLLDAIEKQEDIEEKLAEVYMKDYSDESIEQERSF